MERFAETTKSRWSHERWERNILLIAPPSRELEFHCCVDLLTPEDPENLNVWTLGITLTPDERMRLWQARRDAAPEDFRIVSAQPLPVEATEDRARELGFDPIPQVVAFDDPKNLTRLGVELTESLRSWEDSDNETVVCFHSITSLLQYVTTEQAYRFLHPFTNKIREFDARAHYHVNPQAHDERDIERLSTLFDGVWDPGEM